MKFVVGCDDVETLGVETELVVFVLDVVVVAVFAAAVVAGAVTVTGLELGVVLGAELVVVVGVAGLSELVVVGVTGLTGGAWLLDGPAVDGLVMAAVAAVVVVVTLPWAPPSCPPTQSVLRLSQILQQSH